MRMRILKNSADCGSSIYHVSECGNIWSSLLSCFVFGIIYKTIRSNPIEHLTTIFGLTSGTETLSTLAFSNLQIRLNQLRSLPLIFLQFLFFEFNLIKLMVVFIEWYFRQFVIRFLISDWYTVSYPRYDSMCYKMHARW